MNSLKLAAAALAFVSAASVAAAVPTEGTITCRQHEADETGYHFNTLTLQYNLTPIELFGDDVHATVTGSFAIDACYYRSSGAITGAMTPKVWYGGGFDVDLEIPGDDGEIRRTRFLIFREQGSAYVWMDFGGEATRLSCTGDVP